jgi:adenine-specific DNA-methyltransferase
MTDLPLTYAARLQSRLCEPYARDAAVDWLREIFPQLNAFTRAEPLETSETGIEAVWQLGRIPLADGRAIGVFEVQVDPAKIDLARNRVGLRSVVARFVQPTVSDGALAFFHDGKPSSPTYRLSFIARTAEVSAEGQVVMEQTTPRRYTYTLGPQESCRTAASRLAALRERSLANTLDDVIDAFSVEKLNREFYQELAHWYFWAVSRCRFPDGAEKDRNGEDSIAVIRLITRLVFCWFLKVKRLLPDEVFDPEKVAALLKPSAGFAPDSEAAGSPYYRAILQNLFFATLNTPMNSASEPENRTFSRARRADYMMARYRYRDLFRDPEAFIEQLCSVPFLNGGLFESLDRPADPEAGDPVEVRIDGFSDNAVKNPVVPDCLFFAAEAEADLSRDFGDRRYRETRVRGLIPILSSYHFTIVENDPVEQEVALDPELLGRVFENLLAAYNPETDETARKQTGSFYTPREIVDFMVDQALLARLADELAARSAESGQVPERLRRLLGYDTNENPFTPAESRHLISALDALKILDPACGSGAFPMGTLQKMVHVLRKLDPDNTEWRARQLAKARALDNAEARRRAVAAVEDTFGRHGDDYGRKLFLIENCLYGVDIQPIAVQIAKLRFFISLVVDQEVDNRRRNRGIIALPNLETRIVAANTLLTLHRRGDQLFGNPAVAALDAELAEVRHEHFSADSYAEKKRLRLRDRQIRQRIARLLTDDGFYDAHEAQLIASWNPYLAEQHADYFDAERMFNLPAGFDIVVGNPPYVRHEKIKSLKPRLKELYHCFTGTADLFVYFYERSLDLLRPGGYLSFITSNKYLRAGYGERLRHFLTHTTEVRRLIDFGDAPLFTAIAYPSIILAKKIRETRDKSVLPAPGDNTPLRPIEGTVEVLPWEPGPTIASFPEIFARQRFTIQQAALTVDGWRLENPVMAGLLAKIRAAGQPLSSYVSDRFYYGVKTGFNKAFVLENRQERDDLIAEDPAAAALIKPFFRGRDVKRWTVDFAEQYLIVIESSENKTHPWSDKSGKAAESAFKAAFPGVWKRFNAFRDELVAREDQGRFFWELRSCAYWKEFGHPKIAYQEIATFQAFAWDSSGYIATNKVFIIPQSTPYVLGILNSRPAWWLLNQVSTKMVGGALALQMPFLGQVPIPEGQPARQDAVENRVRSILGKRASSASAFVADLEAEIDGLVAHLYGLSEDEFRLLLHDLDLTEPVRTGALQAYRDVARGLLA